jgi:hypothetical protein
MPFEHIPGTGRGLFMSPDTIFPMRKYFLGIVILISTSMLAQPVSDTESADKTGGMLNGRAWKPMSRTDRLYYVQGLREGLSFILRAKNPEGLPPEEIFAAKFSTGEIVTELDKLFVPTENVRIPITAAYEHVAMKLTGRLSSTELEQHLIRLRTSASRF